MITRERSTAIHEAGHLAVALLYGWRITEAKVRPTGLVTAVMHDVADRGRRLVFAVAGTAAECRLLGAGFHVAGIDAHLVDDTLAALNGHPTERDRSPLYHLAILESLAFVDRERSLILTLADALEARGQLTHHEARAVARMEYAA